MAAGVNINCSARIRRPLHSSENRRRTRDFRLSRQKLPVQTEQRKYADMRWDRRHVGALNLHVKWPFNLAGRTYIIGTGGDGSLVDDSFVATGTNFLVAIGSAIC